MKKGIKLLMIGACVLLLTTGCDSNTDTQKDKTATLEIGNKLAKNQPTPSDIDYSLERYNLTKRAYWVNGMRDKARSLAAPIADMPLGYIVLLTDNGSVVGRFVVDGKVSSLNSFLTPDSEYYEMNGSCDGYVEGESEGTTSERCKNEWLPDVDGSYGNNDNGIFFFTTDGKYIEWTGTYLYSDIPFIVKDPIVKVGE